MQGDEAYVEQEKTMTKQENLKATNQQKHTEMGPGYWDNQRKNWKYLRIIF